MEIVGLQLGGKVMGKEQETAKLGDENIQDFQLYKGLEEDERPERRPMTSKTQRAHG